MKPIRSMMMIVLLALPACDTEDGTHATGTLEMVEVDVAPMQSGRIVEVRAREGDRVRAGQVLAVVDQPAAEGQVPQAEATVSAAEARLRDLQAGARGEEIARARAELRVRQAEAERAARELERLRALLAAGAVSEQDVDNARAAARVAAGARDAAAEAVRLLRAGTRPQAVEAARADVQRAEAALTAARETRDRLTLAAPLDGIVTGRWAEPGEVAATGQPLLTVGDPARPWTHVYVGPRVLPRLRVGQTVAATLDGYPDRPFRGTITAIAPRAEFTPRVALTEDERDDLLFAVRIDFADTTGMLKPGLPVTVRIPSDEDGGG